MVRRITSAALASLASAFLASALCTCGEPRARRAPEVQLARDQDRSEDEEVLAWTRAEGEAEVTLRLRRGGHVAARTPGIAVVTPRGEWTYHARVVEVGTDACVEDDRTITAPGPGRSVHVAFARDGDTQVVFAPPRHAPEVNEVEETVRVHASLGPLVFLERQSALYACGAHGMTEHTFVIWDLDRGAPSDVLGAMPHPAMLQRRAEAALAESAPGRPVLPAGEPPQLTMLLPVLRTAPTPKLDFEAQLTVPTCFACSDGLWSSYTRSVRVPASPPAALASRSQLPGPLVDYLRRSPSSPVRGWSSVRLDRP